MTYTSEEIQQLLMYVKEMGEQNETLRAQLMACMAKLKNEESKTKRLTQILKLYEANTHNPNTN
jgi:hypothetical protein